MIKKAFEWDFAGSCDPNKTTGRTWETFSVGIFQWIPKTSGKGLKKGAVQYRVKGLCKDPKTVYKKAAEICGFLDLGHKPTTKYISLVKREND